MGSAGLNGFAVLHHGLNAEGLHRAGETFALAFLAGENGNGEVFAREGLIDAQHFCHLLPRFGLGLMGGVAFLPEKFSRAQKETRAHFPADDVGPLVDQNR
ncbi:MAG: hypothetical protein ACOYMV_14350, partial [Verrucomicrobiia bacterium]